MPHRTRGGRRRGPHPRRPSDADRPAGAPMLRVVIVGGGTGGMCLAHGLRGAGVSVTVLERYRSRTDGLFGYRVGIDPTGGKALRECLSPQAFALFLATCARRPTAFNVWTQNLRPTASITLPKPAIGGEAEQSVSRAVLRQVLFTGMDEVVEYGKTFTHYAHNDDGTITAFCSDGTSYSGDVLVGADGTRSAVRDQLLPQAEIREAGVIAIATKTPVTNSLREYLPGDLFGGINMIFATKGMVGVLHTMEFNWDRFGNPKPGVDPSTRDTLEAWPDIRKAAGGDYVNLSVMTAADRFPDGILDSRGTDLITAAVSKTKN